MSSGSFRLPLFDSKHVPLLIGGGIVIVLVVIAIYLAGAVSQNALRAGKPQATTDPCWAAADSGFRISATPQQVQQGANVTVTYTIPQECQGRTGLFAVWNVIENRYVYQRNIYPPPPPRIVHRMNYNIGRYGISYSILMNGGLQRTLIANVTIIPRTNQNLQQSASGSYGGSTTSQDLSPTSSNQMSPSAQQGGWYCESNGQYCPVGPQGAQLQMQNNTLPTPQPQ